MCKTLVIALLFVASIGSIAANTNTLSLRQAVKLGLEHNHSIHISRIDSAIAENNDTWGNAGALPQVSLNMQSFQGSSFGGADLVTLGASLQWVVFDGFAMFINKSRLSELKEMGIWQWRAGLESTIARINIAYASVIRQKALLSTVQEAVSFSQERLKLDSTAVLAGSLSQLDLLQAKTDLNEDKSELLRLQKELQDAMAELNVLLGREPAMELVIDDTLAIKRDLSLNQLETELKQQNPLLQQARLAVEISSQELKLARSRRLPTVSVGVGYDFYQWELENGIRPSDQDNLGIRYGITMSLPLFDGFNINRRIKNSRLQTKAAEYEMELQTLQIMEQWQKSVRNYQNSLERMELEQSNLESFRLNQELALERHRLGSYSNLELRQAQLAYLSAVSRLETARFEAKLSETEILRLSGQLADLL